MSIKVREARKSDLDSIVDFNIRLARESEDKSLEPSVVREGVRRLLADPGLGRYLVATDEDRVVGQLMHTFEWSDWRCGMFWWLQSVYVAHEYRRAGVFSALFEQLLAMAREAGNVCGLRLYVENDNLAAQQTYERRDMRDPGYQIRELMLT